MKMSTPHLVISLFTIIVCSTAFATEYYRWQDSLGSTQYTVEPPPDGVSYDIVNIRDGKSSRDNNDSTDAEASASPTPAEQPTTDIKDEDITSDNVDDVITSRCDAHRKNLERLENNPVLVSKDPETGENIVVTDEQRAKMLEETRAALKDCEAAEKQESQ